MSGNRRIAATIAAAGLASFLLLSAVVPPAIAGSAPNPVIAVDPDLLNFGVLEIGEERDRQLTISNVGDEGWELLITGLTASGTGIGIVDPPLTPFTILVGEPLTLTIRGRAILVGLVIGAITIESNDPTRPVVEVRVDLFGNRPPSCSHGGPYQAPMGTEVEFDASGSLDPDGSITRYSWEFGDGHGVRGATPTHVYTAGGVYTVTLCVRDNRNSERCCATTADIAGPPICDAGGPYDGRANNPVTFDGSGSIGDGTMIVAYDWEFGDGASGEGAMPTHTYAALGDYEVTLCVTDAFGFASCCRTEASVNSENPPLCDAGGNYVAPVEAPIAFDGSGSTDPDGQITEYAWEFGDGGTATGVSPTHAYTSRGTYLVTLCLSDDEGGRSCCNTESRVFTSYAHNYNTRFVLHAVETDSGACEIGDPCADGWVNVDVTPGATIAAYLLVSAFDHIAGVQTAFDFGGFTLLSNVWNCQSNQLVAKVPRAPGGPTEGTLSTAFDCVVDDAWGSAVIGRMHLIATSGCLTQVESSLGSGTHVLSCQLEATPVPEDRRGSICAGVGGVDGCWPEPAVTPSTWGAIKAGYR